MKQLGLERDVADQSVYDNTVARFRERQVAVPTFSQLVDPTTIPANVTAALKGVGPDDAHALNLFRIHWYNDADRRGTVPVPAHVVLPSELTGVDARIVVLLADRFPMIGAHKVLATFGCLAPRVVTGQFDPTRHKAIWPSTGNYCRGGVAVSRIMGCHGVAVLPEGMSQERFEWLERWVVDDSDIIRTPGTESNVKEIYDECARLAVDPANIIFNQFSEFGNSFGHYFATGRAIEHVFEEMSGGESDLRLRAFVSATGSAGTIGAGDYLKERLGTRIGAVEALECPTMLENGFGAHNIQGIGDKHIPLIFNAMNMDFAIAVSDRATDRLNLLFNTDTGRSHLAQRRAVPSETIEVLSSFGLSSICNILAAIKLAKQQGYGRHDVVATVATDGAPMYHSERDIALQKYFPDGFDDLAASEVFGEHLLGVSTDNMIELTRNDRLRLFNLGYYTWVEQQGISSEEFQMRMDQSFWTGVRTIVQDWDEMIGEFNDRTGVLKSL
ncbi:MAG: pyridoxal-phosphate dependent enzyme [Acidimicrobiales bacterium]